MKIPCSTTIQHHFVSSWSDALTFPRPHTITSPNFTFLTLFLKLLGLQETVLKASAGS
jgi:hypothetical protein